MTTPNGILDFISEITWEDLPPQVRLQSKLCLLDLIGVGAGGAKHKIVWHYPRLLRSGYERCAAHDVRRAWRLGLGCGACGRDDH